MRLIFATCFLLISSSLGCAAATDVLSETDFQNIISDGKWNLMYKIDKSLEPIDRPALDTEFQFFGEFPYVCRIIQRCYEQVAFSRLTSITVLITMDDYGLLNFVVYKIDSEGSRSDVTLDGTYSYAVYKYVPQALLILYTSTPIASNYDSRYELLVLHKAEAKDLLGRKIDLETVFASFQLGGIFANKTLYLDQYLSCLRQSEDLRLGLNFGAGNPRGNWRFALASFVIGKILLQIYRN